MKERFIENGIEYVRNGDYYIPNLKVPGGNYNIGKYGRMHAKFIKENRPCFYSMKMIDGTWFAYIKEINTSVKEMVDRLIKDLVAPSQQKWTQKSFKKRNESQYFVNLLKPTAFIPRFA